MKYINELEKGCPLSALPKAAGDFSFHLGSKPSVLGAISGQVSQDI